MSDGQQGGAAAGGDGAGAGGASFASVFGASGGEGGGGAAAGGDGGSDGAAAGGEGGAAASSDPEWYGQLSNDAGEEGAGLQDWVKSVGVKDLNGLAKIARDNQKALRESGRIKVPGEGASPEEVSAFHRAIGVPDKPEGYGVPVPRGADGKPLTTADGQPVTLNEPLIQRLAGVAHKEGVPKAAFEAFVQDYVHSQLEEIAAQDAAQNAEAAKKVKEWGAEANANVAAIDNAIRALGLSKDEALGIRQTLGASRAMDMFLKLGNGLAEDVMLNGKGENRFGISAAEAQQQINAMKADTAVAKAVQVKGSPENLRWERLNQIVADEEDRK